MRHIVQQKSNCLKYNHLYSKRMFTVLNISQNVFFYAGAHLIPTSDPL